MSVDIPVSTTGFWMPYALYAEKAYRGKRESRPTGLCCTQLQDLCRGRFEPARLAGLKVPNRVRPAQAVKKPALLVKSEYGAGWLKPFSLICRKIIAVLPGVQNIEFSQVSIAEPPVHQHVRPLWNRCAADRDIFIESLIRRCALPEKIVRRSIVLRMDAGIIVFNLMVIHRHNPGSQRMNGLKVRICLKKRISESVLAEGNGFALWAADKVTSRKRFLALMAYS